MKKQSSLKICVLGGRNFGKTSLLSSLILISGDKDSGITVSGGNEQKLNIYNEYKNNNGKLIATNWDDICKFRYNLTGNGKQKYKLTFIDYPGEFFQKFFSDSGAFSARFLSMLGLQKKSSRTEDANRTFTKNEAKLARQLVAELTSADAFIVLLPADITKDIYKVNLPIFKTQLQVLLEKIHNINPYIPVCLAINKWDMFDKPDSELTDVLRSKPYQDFDNMLTRDCGDYYFCQAISAFGKNRSAEATTEAEQEDFKEEWDRKSEPVNVMQMLLKISEAAEKSRYLHLREKYKKATVLSKILHFPAVFASYCRKGANAEEDRNFCSKGFTRCVFALTGTIVSIVVLYFVIAGTLTTLDEFAYLKIQGSNIAEIEKSFAASKTNNTSADKIQELKKKLAGHPGKLAFFCTSQVDALSARITEIEHQYNSRIWQNAVAFCDDNRNKDEKPQKLKSEERKERCRNRIEHLKAEQEKLTDLPSRSSDGRTLKDCFDQKIERENGLLVSIGKDGSLDDALYALKMKQGTEEECRCIESLIDKYESTYPHRKEDFDELKQQLSNLEKGYNDKLLADLKKIKDFDSKDFDRRISLAQQRIARIEQESQYLSTRSSCHKVNAQSISAENQNIVNWKYDSKFYVAFDAAMKPGDNQIQRLVGFLNTYKKESYSRCAADWDAAYKKKNELIAAVNKNLENIIKNNSIDVKDIRADERKRRIDTITKAYQVAKVANPTETLKYDQKIAALTLQLQQVEKDKIFETDYANAMKVGEDQIQRLVKFLKKYQKSPSDRYTADWDAAYKKKNELIAALNKNLENIIKNNPVDAANIDAVAREKRIDIIINAFIEAQKNNPTQFGEYSNKIAEFKLQRQQVENDKTFESAHKSAMTSGKNHIQRLVDFFEKYPESPSERYTDAWNNAVKKKNELIDTANSNLQKILDENSVAETKITAVEKVKRLQNCIKAYEQAKKENPPEIEKYDAEIATLERNLAVAKKDTEFEAEYNNILASADNGKLMRINSFITAGEFAKENYPHKAAEYKKLEEEKARLLNKWNKEQEDARKRYPDDVKQSRAIRLACAEKLLTEYNRLLVEYLPASTEYNSLNRCILDLNGQIAEHKKYNALLNEFNKIKTLTNSFRIVNAIAAFDIDFKASDYPAQDGVTIFAELNSLRKQHNDIVTGKFYEAEQKFKKPADNEFARLAEYYQKLRQNVDTFMQKISEDIPFYKDLQNLKNMYGNNIKKYQRFAKITAELEPLISDDGQKSVKDARNRLSAIKAFYANEDFSKELASTPELVDFSNSLKKIQNGVENFIAKELSAQLENISKNLPIGASPEDQMANWRQQLDLIEDFCSIMIQSKDNALYRNFSTQRKDLQTRFDKKELRTRFDNARNQLNSQLESELNVTEKIDLIDNFVRNYGDYEDFKEEITGYMSKQNNYKQIRKFDLFEQGCNTLISNKPANYADFNDLTEYRDGIQKKLDRIKEFESFSGEQKRVEDLKTRLLEEIDYVKKAIGDGSWDYIRRKEEEYKNNPTESTYDILQRAIKSFDPKEYSSNKDKVEDIKRKSQEDYRLAKNLKEAISEYRNCPNHNSFNKFYTALQILNSWIQGTHNQAGYGSKHNVEEYTNYIQNINSEINITVTCADASFEAEWTKLTYNISCGGQNISGEYYPSGIFSGSDKGKISLPRNGSLKCELKFENIASYRPKQTFISFWQIVQWGNGRQSFKVVVDEKMLLKDRSFYEATFNVDISEVPELPKEFEL